jgi:hypothetical protein
MIMGNSSSYEGLDTPQKERVLAEERSFDLDQHQMTGPPFL